MPQVPVQGRYKESRGANAAMREKVAAHNAMVDRIVAYINKQVACDPDELQQYLYGFVAIDLGLTKEQVSSAVMDGGSNGITLRVRPEDRLALERYKQ
jgi:hypothetical protein